jgi:hypothetical protein
MDTDKKNTENGRELIARVSGLAIPAIRVFHPCSSVVNRSRKQKIRAEVRFPVAGSAR